MKEDPAPGTKCRDKFLVQSIIVTMDKDSTSLPELVSVLPRLSSPRVAALTAAHILRVPLTHPPARTVGSSREARQI